MPVLVYNDDVRGTRKFACLEALGRAIFSEANLLPPLIRARMVRYFEYGDWSGFPGGRPRKIRKSSPRKRKR